VDFDDWIRRFGDVSTTDIQERGRCLACGTGGAGTIVTPLSSRMKGGDTGGVAEYHVEVPQGMCGRFTNKLTWQEVHDLYRLTDPPMNLRPRYNIAPTQDVLAVVQEEDGRHARMMRWGLIPHWAKEPLKASTINARAETITEKPLWREPFRKRRCIIPACGFYEWRKEGNAKQPYRIERADGQPLSFAGLWASNETLGVVSCAIVVCEANQEMRPYHDRMPVILDREGVEGWLAQPAQELLQPSHLPWKIFAVSRDVGSVRNDRPELIEPLYHG
jgi:putative SOS response-associated peptidase YedK